MPRSKTWPRLALQPFWHDFCRAPNLLYKLNHSPYTTPHLDPNGVFLCALCLSHYCSQPSSIYLHLPCTVSINKVLVCNWSHNPRYCTESQYPEESLPLHQSDPYLKASNLPYISLINSLNFLLLSQVHWELLCKSFIIHSLFPLSSVLLVNQFSCSLW